MGPSRVAPGRPNRSTTKHFHIEGESTNAAACTQRSSKVDVPARPFHPQRRPFSCFRKYIFDQQRRALPGFAGPTIQTSAATIEKSPSDIAKVLEGR